MNMLDAVKNYISVALLNKDAAQDRYAFLDSIRGIAILLVIMVHVTSGVHIDFSELLNNFFHSGSRGVQLFFILSGFTLLLQMENSIKKNGYADWKGFYLRRFFRIMPLWLLMLPVYMLFAKQNDWLDIVGTATFINGFIPSHSVIISGGWSIFVEVIFYALFPLFCILATSYLRLIVSLIFLLSVSFLWREFASTIFTDLSADYIYQFPLTHLFFFFLGMSLYRLYENGHEWSASKNFTIAIDILTIGGFILLLPVGLAVASAAFLLLFISNFFSNGILRKYLDSSILLQKFGEYSYGIYLFHFIVIKLTRFFDVRGIPMVPPIMETDGITQIFYVIVYMLEVSFLSFLVAAPVYHFFELKFIKMGRSMSNSYVRTLA